jgi:hypothetical protein
VREAIESLSDVESLSFWQRFLSSWHQVSFSLRRRRSIDSALGKESIPSLLEWPSNLLVQRECVVERLTETERFLASLGLSLPSQIPVNTWVWLESLAVLKWLSQTFLPACHDSKKELVRWLDVGSKQFAYAPALVLFAQQALGACRVILRGIELDGFKTDSAGVARWQYAYSVINCLNTVYEKREAASRLSVFYEVGSIETHRPEEGYDVVSLFLPFVVPGPLVAWGLPLSTFNPLRVLRACYDCLRLGGVLFIINLTVEEASQQALLLQQLAKEVSVPFRVEALGALARAPIASWQCQRQGWLIVKGEEGTPW